MSYKLKHITTNHIFQYKFVFYLSSHFDYFAIFPLYVMSIQSNGLYDISFLNIAYRRGGILYHHLSMIT